MPFLTSAAKANPEGVALAGRQESVTFGELAQKARVVAERLRAMGVRAGTVVAVKGSLDAELLAALHGIWMAGGAVAPVNLRWTGEEEERALGLLEPEILVQGGQGDSGSLQTTRLQDPLPPEPSSHVESAQGPPPPSGEGQLAARLLTSGTSGEPRVVDLTVDNLLASARGAQERLGLGPDDRWLASLSLAHVGGLALVTRAAALGSTLVLSDGSDPRIFLDLAEAGTITHASLVPTMLHRILEALGEGPAPEGLGCLLIGGAATPMELVDNALEAGLPLALTYGLTEASSQVATASPTLVRRKPGTVGAPLAGIEVRLSEQGEILVRGATVAPGEADEEGWLETGDLARMDADGHLWITGRTSDRIISGGVNVDPVEVAAVLRNHAGVEEAVVVGIPDPEWGERVVAVVVPRTGYSLTPAQLDQWTRTILSAAKRPRAIHLVDEIPRNPNGKADRERVRSLFR